VKQKRAQINEIDALGASELLKTRQKLHFTVLGG
jgi:hypothetical protein